MGICKPPYKHGNGDIGWCDCKFPELGGAFRPECYDFVKFNYYFNIKPYCPDRVIVIEICDTNASKDDNIKVSLNGTVIASELDFSVDERNGYFLIAHPSAVLDVEESSLRGTDLSAHPESCYYVPGYSDCWCHAKGNPALPPEIIRFDPELILGGENIISTSLVKPNFNGNFGSFNVRSYLYRDGKLICGCNAAEPVKYSDPPQDLSFIYDNCCGTGEVPPCPTPTATPYVTPSGGSSCCTSTGCVDINSESECESLGGTFYGGISCSSNTICGDLAIGACCGPEVASCITVNGAPNSSGESFPICRIITRPECNVLGGSFTALPQPILNNPCGQGSFCAGYAGSGTLSFVDICTSGFVSAYKSFLSFNDFDESVYFPLPTPYVDEDDKKIEVLSKDNIKIQSTTNYCNVEFNLGTTGCCLEYLLSSKIIRAVGDGNVFITDFTQTPANCCSKIRVTVNGTTIYLNGTKYPKSVKDGDILIVKVYDDCKSKSPTDSRSGFGYNEPECPDAGPYKILKNVNTGKHKILLNKGFFRK